MHLDMTRPDREMPTGTNLWRLVNVQTKTSGKGHAMLAVKFEPADGSAAHLYDNIMLQGGGWAIGKPKLVALGVPADFQGDLDPQKLVGRRVWIDTFVQNHNGRDGLKVNIQELSHAGYQPEDTPPKGVTVPEKAAAEAFLGDDDGSSIPF